VEVEALALQDEGADAVLDTSVGVLKKMLTIETGRDASQ
jgi:hypothetical protein